MKKIWLDVFGCDHPDAVINGAAEVSRNLTEGFLLAVPGDTDYLKNKFISLNADLSRIELIQANDIITNEDSPANALMKKRDSSMFRCFLGAAEDEGQGVITAGNTGAALVGSAAFLGRAAGISSPVLSAFLPCIDGSLAVLADCGANVDCRPSDLVHFAELGSDLKRKMGIHNPSCALLSVGTEDTKGNSFTKEAFKLLKESKVRFLGNVEARDVLSGKYDVIVCDGFSGNVLLKSIEGTALYTIQTFVRILKEKMPDKVKELTGDVMSRLDMQSLAGAMILGVKKPVVKLHGSANEKSVVSAVHQLMMLNQESFSSEDI